ncbi:MAG: hypothetical protein ACP5L5_08720 [Vulcanisaeta sp.]
MNRSNKWMPEEALKRIVYEAVAELPIKRGRRLERSVRTYAVPA